MSVFYMSFCDPDLPEGTQWLGGCYVPAEDLAMAMTVSHLTGCNPGGEVQVLGPFPSELVKPEFLNKLLDRDGVEDAYAGSA